MRRAVAGIWWSPTIEGTPALVVTAIFFTLGGLVGCFLGLWSAESGVEAMAGYLDRFFAVAGEGALCAPEGFTLLWRAARWPLGAFLLGFTALGLLGIPVLAFLRGFFLAFSIASFTQAYGQIGLAAAFFLLGVPALVCVPAFLLLATQSFAAACCLAGRAAGQGRRELPYRRDYFLRCGVCAALVCIGLLLERYLVPVLVTGLSASAL